MKGGTRRRKIIERSINMTRGVPFKQTGAPGKKLQGYQIVGEVEGDFFNFAPGPQD